MASAQTLQLTNNPTDAPCSCWQCQTQGRRADAQRPDSSQLSCVATDTSINAAHCVVKGKGSMPTPSAQRPAGNS